MVCAFSFEQEVLGGPVSGGPAVMDALPIALAVPVVRPIIGTNTYRQVCTKILCTRRLYVGVIILNQSRNANDFILSFCQAALCLLYSFILRMLGHLYFSRGGMNKITFLL